MQKKCSQCKAMKSIYDFYKNRNKSDGLSTECKVCVKHKVSIYSKQNMVERSSYHSKWRAENREKVRKLNSESLKRNREKANIRQKLRYAISKGHIEAAKACWHCGGANPEAHHASYDPSMWNIVTWLCRRCHRECHREAA